MKDNLLKPALQVFFKGLLRMSSRFLFRKMKFFANRKKLKAGTLNKVILKG